MSSRAAPASVVIEWSPGAVAAYDTASNRIYRGRSLADVAPHLNSREAVMAIGRRACFVRSVNVPDAPKQDLLQALSLSIGQHVPIGPGDACVDLRLVGDVGPDGRTATLVAMRAADLRALHEEAKQAGIRIIATVPAAYGSWLLANGTALADCAAVSESSEGIGVDLISAGELRYSRALPPESNNGHLAPELARTFGAAGLKPAPTLAQGVRVASAEYAVEKSPLEALSGTAWSTPGVQFELPETLLARAKAAKSIRSRLALLMCLSAGLFMLLVYMDRADAQSAVNKREARAARALQDFRDKRDALQMQVNDATAMAKLLDRGFDPAQKLGDVITLMSNDLPKNAWLTNVGVSRGENIVVRGTAMANGDVANYLQALSNEKRLRDVRLVFSNNAQIESTPVVQFAVSAFPVGNLPLIDKSSKEARR